MKKKISGSSDRVERLVADKRHIRETYSRFPWMDWFKKEKKPEKIDGVEIEKNDVWAMILAALSLVLPMILGFGALVALFLFLVQLIWR